MQTTTQEQCPPLLNAPDYISRNCKTPLPVHLRTKRYILEAAYSGRLSQGGGGIQYSPYSPYHAAWMRWVAYASLESAKCPRFGSRACFWLFPTTSKLPSSHPAIRM